MCVRQMRRNGRVSSASGKKSRTICVYELCVLFGRLCVCACCVCVRVSACVRTQVCVCVCVSNARGVRP